MEKLPDDVDAEEWGREHLKRYFTIADPKPEDVDAKGFESFLHNRQVLYDLGFTPASLTGIPFVVISAMGAWFEESDTENLPIARGQVPRSLWGAHVYDTEGWRARGFLGFEADNGGTLVPLYIDDNFYEYNPSVLLNINTQTKGAGPKFWKKLKEEINEIYATDPDKGKPWKFGQMTSNIKAQVYKVFIEPLLDPSNLDPDVVQMELEEARRREAAKGGAGPAPSVPPAAAAGTSRSTGIVVEDTYDDEPLDLSGVKKRGDEDRLRELEAKLKAEKEKKSHAMRKFDIYKKMLSDEMPELESRRFNLPKLKKEVSDTERRLPELRKDLSDTERRLPGLRKDLSDTERRLPGLKEEVSTVEYDIFQLKRRFSAIQKIITKWTNEISAIDATIARVQEEIEDLAPSGKRARTSGVLYDHTV